MELGAQENREVGGLKEQLEQMWKVKFTRALEAVTMKLEEWLQQI